MNEIIGYVQLSPVCNTGMSPLEMSNFADCICRVLEFNREGGVLVVSPDGDGLGMFDKEDIVSSFRCSTMGQVICPPDLDEIRKMEYYYKASSRKGGYNNTIKDIVIALSLSKNTFTDSFLFDDYKTTQPT